MAPLAASIAFSVANTAGATPISPEGSLTLALENFASGPPYYSEPYFVYSSNGGTGPTFNSSNNTWSGGTSGQMTASNAAPQGVAPAAATVTIQGQRYVFAIGTVNNINNLGINVGDLQTLLTSGTYPDGTYSQATSLIVTIDGLKFEFNSVGANYFTAGNAAFQNDDFIGQMDAGTNTSTGQSYSQGIVNLDLSLNQSNVAGNSTIGYTVTLNVQPGTIPEPAGITVLGAGLAALGVMRQLGRSRRGDSGASPS